MTDTAPETAPDTDRIHLAIDKGTVDVALFAWSIFNRMPAAEVRKLEKRLTKDRVIRNTAKDLQELCQLVGFSCMMAIDKAIKAADEKEASDGTSEGTI